jgi:uncharacterized repeat protein (TIGR02543 family)
MKKEVISLVVSYKGGFKNVFFQIALIIAVLTGLTLVSCEGNNKAHSFPSAFSVIYDGNDSRGGYVPDSASYSPGQVVTIPGNPGNLVKAGFNFTGWNRDKDGIDRTFTAGETFSMGRENVTLYAQWVPISMETYTVAYDLNGGRGIAPVDGTHYQEGSHVVVAPFSGFSYDGFSFVGWALNKSGSGLFYVTPASCLVGRSDIIFYAKWTPESVQTYSLSYDGNGNDRGTFPLGSPLRYAEGTDVTVMDNTGNFSRQGFIFGGWFRGVLESDLLLKNDHFIMGGADTVLRVHWEKTYSVSYELNGGKGSVPVDAALYKKGDSVPVLAVPGNSEKEGYIFSGWTTDREGSSEVYSCPGTFTMGNADIVFYAKWMQKEIPVYTVVYDLNGGAGTIPVDGAGYQSGSTVSVFPQGDSMRDGCIFEGWTFSSDGSGTVYRAGSSTCSFVISGNQTLYAKWSVIPTYAVVYSAAGSTGGTVPLDNGRYQDGAVVSVLPNSGKLERTGWTFIGWSIAGQAEVLIPGSTTVIRVKGITFEPKWAGISASAEPSYINIGQQASIVVKADLNSFGSIVPSSVTADLSSAGGGMFSMYDDGDNLHGDIGAGDGIYSCIADVTALSAGMKNIKIEADASGIPVTGSTVLMAGLAFANSDMEADMHAVGKVGTTTYSLLPIASYGSTIDRTGNVSRALHISGENAGAAFIFTSAAPLNAQGSFSRISFMVNGSIKINGVSANKSLSCQIGSKGLSAGTQLFPCGSIGTSDIVISGAAAHSYTGKFDTGGSWVKITLNLAGAVPTQTSGSAYSDAAGNVLFSIKVGGISGAVCDFWIDDILYEK